jgi:uncharacterized protein
VKFIADSMLGSLARWLRMMGHDVVYDVSLEDSQILELSKKENRNVLTKDLELYQRAIRRSIDAFYFEGKKEFEYLAELAKRYGLNLEIDMDKSHCPVCNTPLKSTPKEQLLRKLEKNTLIYYDKFWRCPNCRQIYWQGAHWKQIIYTLNQAQQKLEKSK